MMVFILLIVMLPPRVVAVEYLPNMLANYVLWIIGFAVMVLGAGLLVLGRWRTCDTCGKFLFEFDSLPRPGGRHPAARTVLGSYQIKAMLDSALGRRVHCMWCRHEDGPQWKHE